MNPNPLYIGASLALMVAFPWLALHLAGWRDATTILSGTWPATGDTGVFFGLAYVGTWFVAVLGAPPLLLAGALLWFASGLEHPRIRAR